jgi:hypothetical protein
MYSSIDQRVSCAHVHGENARRRHDDGTHMSRPQRGRALSQRGPCHIVPPSET